MKKPPEILATETVARSRLFSIEAVTLRFSNQQEAVFERLVGPAYGAVLVMPVLDDNLVLVREYAAGVERYELGFVKGRVDEGETIEQAAQREMKEEIGFGAHSLQHIRTISTSPAYSNFISHLFIARDLYHEQLPGDEIEPLQQVLWPIARINELFDHPDVNDARVLLGLMMFKNLIAES